MDVARGRPRHRRRRAARTDRSRARSSSPTVPLDADEPALSGYRRVLANLADTIEANRPGTIDDIDEEFLHELRVAVRRTPHRCWRRARAVLPDDVRDRYREAFGELGQQTGPARDLDVYVVGWDALRRAARAHRRPWPRQGAARDRAPTGGRPPRAVHGARERRAAERRSTAGARGWPTPTVDGRTRASRSGRSWPSGSRRRRRRCSPTGAPSRPASPGERLHDLRKDAKKLRYLLECFGSLFPADERKAFVSQLKDLQDNLGEHQDAEVHLAQLRDLAHDLHERSVVDTDALLAMGRLSDQLERRRAEERAAFAKRFARYDRKANRKDARALLEEVRDAVKVVATYSIKGGVGKTTTAVNLAYEAGRAGVRVLVWDLDPQGAATYLLRVRPKVRGGSRRLVSAKGALADHVRGTDLDAVHVLPADFSLRHLDVHLEGTAAPAPGGSRRSSNRCATTTTWPSSTARRASRWRARACSARPTRCSCPSCRPPSPAAPSAQLTAFLDDQLDAPAVAPFLSMVDRRRRLHRELVDSLGSDWPELLATAVPAAAVIERMGTERAPLGRLRAEHAGRPRLPPAVDGGGRRPLGCRLGAGGA